MFTYRFGCEKVGTSTPCHAGKVGAVELDNSLYCGM